MGNTSLICSKALASVWLHNQATDGDDAAVCENNQPGPVERQPGHFVVLTAIKCSVAAFLCRINTASVGRPGRLMLYSSSQLHVHVHVCACACISCCHQGWRGIGSDRKLYGLVSEAVFFYREPIRLADILLLVVLIKKNRSIGERGKGCRAPSLL